MYTDARFPATHFMLPTLITMTLPTRSQFVLCQALDYWRRVASTSNRLSSSRTSCAVEGDCDELTEIGDLCNQHAIDLLGLRVKTSTLENAGLGLFTTRPRRKGDYICPYLGRIVSSVDYEIAPDEYSVEIGRERVLSARYSSDGFGRYANDGRSSAVNNCLLLTEATYARVHAPPGMRRRGRASSEAVICFGGEEEHRGGSRAVCEYGRDYWEKRQRC